MAMVVKDPDARIDYEFDWAAAYPDGQAVMASSWTVAPDGGDGIEVAAAAHDLTRTTMSITSPTG